MKTRQQQIAAVLVGCALLPQVSRADEVGALIRLGRAVDASVVLSDVANSIDADSQAYATTSVSSAAEGDALGFSGDLRERNRQTLERVWERQSVSRGLHSGVNDQQWKLIEMRTRMIEQMSNQRFKLDEMRTRMTNQQLKFIDSRPRLSDQQWKLNEMRSRIGDQQWKMAQQQQMLSARIDDQRWRSWQQNQQSQKVIGQWAESLKSAMPKQAVDSSQNMTLLLGQELMERRLQVLANPVGKINGITGPGWQAYSIHETKFEELGNTLRLIAPSRSFELRNFQQINGAGKWIDRWPINGQY